MRVMRYISYAFLLALLAGCGQIEPVCPPVTGTPQYLTGNPQELATAPFEPSSTPSEVEIRGRIIAVDQVASGPLCNGTWRGSVYVSCDVQVYAWEEEPLFLEDCDLAIEPGTVVYVADHNDTAYYNGCSCHTGEVPVP